jgi:fructose-1-phosphate kinase PfkB-like protein
VLVTLGGDGMMAAAAGGVWRVRVPEIEVVTAVGSGDAFVGGWAATVERHGPVPEPSEELIVEALKRGSAAGVSNALHVETGTCDPDQVADLMEQIEVTRVL